MSLSRLTGRLSRTVLTRYRNSPPLSGRHDRSYISSLTNHLPSPYNKVSLIHHSALKSSAFKWPGFSSSASPQPNEIKTTQSGNEQGIKNNNEADSDLESDLSRDDLAKLVAEKKQLLGSKQEEIEIMKDKVLRTLAEMENVKERTRRESENAKKFAIQNFAKGLLDVADNLGRASSVAKGSFSNMDSSKEMPGGVQQLKTLLEGVEMTEKQLTEVFKKFGLEKYDPLNEEFDPNRHNAVFQVPDASKPADRVAVVLKSGYMLHDRVIRPADVGVTVAANN